MAQIDVAYDHPVYTSRETYSLKTTAGANTVNDVFVAFTNMRALAAQINVRVAGTSATTGHAAIFAKVSGTTTTAITTVALNTTVIGSTTRVELATTSLAAGDLLVCKNGTDATGVSVVAVEAAVIPGSSVTKMA